VTTLTLVLFIMLLPLCLFLIGLILLQGGAGDISSAFGGGGQLDSTLGVGAGRKMSKITGWLAGLFLVIVLVLSIPNSNDILKAAGGSKPASATLTTDPTAPKSPVIEQPAAPTAPALTVPPVTAPAVPPVTAPVVPPVTAPAVPAVTAPAVTLVTAPVVPAVTAPVVPPVTASAVPAADKPAEVPAAPRSGITLDEPKK
jgi:protein translocase SecG subunit